jgi:hypothetical protein
MGFALRDIARSAQCLFRESTRWGIKPPTEKTCVVVSAMCQQFEDFPVLRPFLAIDKTALVVANPWMDT